MSLFFDKCLLKGYVKDCKNFLISMKKKYFKK